MNLADRIAQKKEQKTKFILVAGPRFGGKTGSLGTLSGKTLVIEVTDRESGSEGAVAVARESGNELDVVSAVDCADVIELAKQALDAGYDNVGVDGISALTEVEANKPKMQKMLSGSSSKWDAWRLIGNTVVDMIQELKKMSAESNKPIVLTLAITEERDRDGVVVATKADTKGNMAESYIRGKCPNYVIARAMADKDGNMIHVLQTKPDAAYGARLDKVLAKDLPNGFRTEIDKVPESDKVGFDALLTFLNNY